MSAARRDALLHHHVRGLRLGLEGRPEAAIRAFRSSIYSRSTGYTRTNLALAKLYLDAREPDSAIAFLAPMLRGSIAASGTYATPTEARELTAMAEAWGADRAAAVCRELTKTYEEVRRGPLSELAAWAADGVRGEVTIVAAGAEPAAAVPADDESLSGTKVPSPMVPQSSAPELAAKADARQTADSATESIYPIGEQ